MFSLLFRRLLAIFQRHDPACEHHQVCMYVCVALLLLLLLLCRFHRTSQSPPRHARSPYLGVCAIRMELELQSEGAQLRRACAGAATFLRSPDKDRSSAPHDFAGAFDAYSGSQVIVDGNASFVHHSGVSNGGMER